MKKKILILVGLLFCIGSVERVVQAEESNAATVEIVHQHSQDQCYVYTYHEHIGDDQTEGGCYTQKVVTGTTVSTWEDPLCCGDCGEGPEAHYDGNPYGACDSFNSTWEREVEDYYYDLTCGKTTSTVESCDLSCKISDSGICQVDFKKEISTNGYRIIPNVTQTDWLQNVIFLWDNGDSGACAISENRSYTCSINYKDLGLDKTELVQIIVSDYDDRAPEIVAVAKSMEDITASSIMFSVQASDGGNGIGIAGYKIDNGNWQQENRFLIDKNGDYVVYTKDYYNNVSIGFPIRVSNIDKVAPTGSINADSIKNTAERVVLTVSATDVTDEYGCGGLAEAPYSWDKGKTWTSESTHTISENGIYSIIVRDKAGNQGTTQFRVQNIDKMAPTASISADSSQNTAEKVVLRVTATDSTDEYGCGGLAEVPYSWDKGKTWTSESTRTVSENGIYSIIVRDKAGNQETTQFRVQNIDKVAPTASISADSVKNTAEKVVLRVTATDSTDEYGCGGLAEAPYSWDKGKTWTSESTYTVSENGIYSVMVRDKAGNQGTTQFRVQNIDKVAPTASISADSVKNTAEKVILRVTATDSTDEYGCGGLAEAPYSWDKGKTWTSESTRTISENGIYSIIVRDKAGNQGTAQIRVQNIEKPSKQHEQNQEEKIEEPEENPSEAVAIEPISSTKAAQQHEDNAPAEVLESEIIDLEENTETEKEPEPENIIQIPSISTNLSESKDVLAIPDDQEDVQIKTWFTPKTAVAAVGATTTSGGIFVFVFFWIFRKCRIYDDFTGKMLGKAYIYKHKNTFGTTIPRSICRRASSKIRIHFNQNFVKSNADKAFVIKANGEETVKNIEQDISIKI